MKEQFNVAAVRKSYMRQPQQMLDWGPSRCTEQNQCSRDNAQRWDEKEIVEAISIH